MARQGVPLILRGAALLARVVARLATRISVEGLQNVPRAGPLIIVANHLSNADPPLVVGFLTPALGRPMHILAKQALFVGPLGWFLRSQGVTPVRAGGSDIDAYRVALALLERGEVMCIFPEGTRSRTGELGPPKPGVAMLATRAGVPILPVGISGTDRFLGRGQRLPRLGARIVVRVGPTFTLSLDARHGRRAASEQASEQVMAAIAALIEPRHRGRYGGQPPYSQQASRAIE
jgi:1-acyl-sn-glycerol-3-phosphate acyltransferase